MHDRVELLWWMGRSGGSGGNLVAARMQMESI